MATKINSINNARLTLASHVQFHTEVVALITEVTYSALHLESIYPIYKIVLKEETSVVNRPTAYVETQQMAEADHTRDLAVSLIFNLTDAFSASPLASHSKAATTIAIAMRPYRSIQSHEMNRQTTEVDGMLKALAETAVAAALTTLKIESTVQILSDANAGFKAATAARDAEALRRQPVKEADTRILRADTDEQYHRVIETVSAYAVIDLTDEISTFIDRMNVLIDKYKLVIANQGKSKKTEKETE